MFAFDHSKTRRYTVALSNAVDEGIINKDMLINDLLGYLSEAEVEDFVRKNDMLEYIGMAEDEEEDDE